MSGKGGGTNIVEENRVSDYLRASIYVWTRTSMKGRRRLKISQTSIILTYDVFGKLFETLINIVVSTSIAVRFTVTTASKKNGLKKLVAWPIMLRRTVGR